MSKKKNNLNIILIVGLLAIAFVFIAPAAFNTLEGGVTVLSIDEPNVIGDENLRNLNWLVTTSLSGSDRISFRLTPTDMKEESGVASEKTFTATASNLKETIVYDIIQNPSQAVYSYNYEEVEPSQSCPSGTITSYVIDSGWVWDGWRLVREEEKFCLIRTLYARTGIYEQKSTQFTADLTVSNGAETITEELSSSNAEALSFSTSEGVVARVNWVGSLTTGNTPPSLRQYDAVLRTAAFSRWEPVLETDVESYIRLQETFESYLDSIPITGSPSLFVGIDAKIRGYISQLNNLRSTTIDQVQSLSTGWELKNPSSLSGASLVFDTDAQFTKPVVTWWIRADWIGVERTAGMPRITNLPDVSFGSTGTAYVPVTIKNVGNGRGTFTVELESCPGIVVTQSASRVTLNPGVTGVVGFTIDNGATNQALSQSCTVRAYDTAIVENDDTERFKVTFNPTQLCPPNTFEADGVENAIYRCNGDGTGRSLVEKCDSDEKVSYTGLGSQGGFECVSQVDPAVPPTQGEGRFSLTLLVVTLVLSSSAGLYAWFNTRRINKWLGIGLGIAAFVLVFFLVPAFVNGIIQMFTLNIPGFSVIP